MKTINYKEYFGKQINWMLDANATITVYSEKLINGYRCCLVNKNGIFGIDTFYKNGRIKDFLDYRTFDEAREVYSNKLVF